MTFWPTFFFILLLVSIVIIGANVWFFSFLRTHRKITELRRHLSIVEIDASELPNWAVRRFQRWQERLPSSGWTHAGFTKDDYPKGMPEETFHIWFLSETRNEFFLLRVSRVPSLLHYLLYEWRLQIPREGETYLVGCILSNGAAVFGGEDPAYFEESRTTRFISLESWNGEESSLEYFRVRLAELIPPDLSIVPLQNLQQLIPQIERREREATDRLRTALAGLQNEIDQVFSDEDECP
jgi:hypothetical protein